MSKYRSLVGKEMPPKEFKSPQGKSDFVEKLEKFKENYALIPESVEEHPFRIIAAEERVELDDYKKDTPVEKERIAFVLALLEEDGTLMNSPENDKPMAVEYVVNFPNSAPADDFFKESALYKFTKGLGYEIPKTATKIDPDAYIGCEGRMGCDVLNRVSTKTQKPYVQHKVHTILPPENKTAAGKKRRGANVEALSAAFES